MLYLTLFCLTFYTVSQTTATKENTAIYVNESQEVKQQQIEQQQEVKQQETYLGEFTCSAYTLHPSECGKDETHPAYGITASGKRVEVGHIAVDTRVIPCTV